MPETATRPIAEERTVHAALVRRIAAGVLRRAGGADDLVQDTLAAALERPPRADANLRARLDAVARNLARMRLRGRSGGPGAKPPCPQGIWWRDPRALATYNGMRYNSA